MRGSIAFPALHLGEVIAVLEFYHDQEPEPIERLLDRLIAESVRGVSESGVLGDPSGASGQQGEELLSGMAVQLAGDIRTWRVSKQGRLGSRSPAPAPAQPGVRA